MMNESGDTSFPTCFLQHMFPYQNSVLTRVQIVRAMLFSGRLNFPIFSSEITHFWDKNRAFILSLRKVSTIHVTDWTEKMSCNPSPCGLRNKSITCAGEITGVGYICFVSIFLQKSLFLHLHHVPGLPSPAVLYPCCLLHTFQFFQTSFSVRKVFGPRRRWQTVLARCLAHFLVEALIILRFQGYITNSHCAAQRVCRKRSVGWIACLVWNSQL